MQHVWHELLGLTDTRDGCQEVKEWMLKRYAKPMSTRMLQETRSCWGIWKAMCGQVFEGKQLAPTGMVASLRKILQETRILPPKNGML